MLIYILHSDKYYTFRLPKEVSGSYVLTDYDSEGHIRSLATIQANNNQWYINSNEDISINYNGKAVNNIPIVEYSFYGLKLFGKENILLYMCPGNEENVVVKEVNSESRVVIGKGSSADIVLLNRSVDDEQVELLCSKGVWKIKNLNTSIPVYVNKKTVGETALNNFDVIFVMGLKIVVMKNKMILTSSPKVININDRSLASEKKLYNSKEIKVEENIKDFYNSNDYFLKSPIFRKKYDDYEVTITSPEAKEKGEGVSAISQIVPSALMSVTSLVSTYFAIKGYKNGSVDKETLVSDLIMCGIMLLIGVLWPIIEVIGNKIRLIIVEKVRIHNYKKYINRKRETLKKVLTSEKMALEFNNLSLSSCQDAILNKNSYLYSRNIDSPSFLDLKFGTGKILSSIKFQYSKPDLIVENDKLLKLIDSLMEDFKYIENAPVTLSLKEYTSLALINPESNYSKFLKSIILQLITFHDYKSLKIVCFTDETSDLNSIKNLNHCWNDDRSFRYFASNDTEAENVSSELVREFNKYDKLDNIQESKEYDTHYVIITDSIEKYKNLKIIENVIHSKGNKGFSVVMFSSKLVNVPLGCNAFIEYDDKKASFFQAEMDEKSIVKFTPEVTDRSINFMECINTISNIPIKIEIENKGSLPDKLGFLEMYNVGKVEQLNILNRWKNSTIINSLAAPIGVDSRGNNLVLDLHEKRHGPHGLIAGMTGSGKSEFIITYLLSLAINYSPDEVQFVLIDYKGGGLAGAFENRKTGVKIPHLVGTITNLDKAEMDRTLVSIKSELQRRQKKFNEAKEMLNTGSIDIYKYQSLVRDGTLKDSMSHLFIVCDEFAELKAQQPEFMDELVSAARIGRSLGIHLILATQKPAGVVDDQIWSNSKFKVCCKVQTAEDSNEMIRKPDAAYLKEAGRFYLQVGYDEYFILGQSGYSGVQYMPSETVKTSLDDSISFINNTGDVYKNIVDNTQEQLSESDGKKYGEELNNILKYIVDVASKNGYKYSQLWLDNVPKKLMYSDLLTKYKPDTKPFMINQLIGEYDNPKRQLQGPVYVPITTGGNTLILGSTGMGKTTLLSTIIYSTIISHTSIEANFYIVDFNTESLRKFSKAPQVGEVIGVNDRQKIRYLFYMLEAEIRKRQQYYSTKSGDFLTDVKNGKSIFPNVIVIIHGLEVFKETYEDIHDEIFSSITRNCSKYGIYFIVTAVSDSGVNYAVENNFHERLILNLGDPSEYVNYFNDVKIPSKNPGRGLIEIDSECVEFQTSLIFDEEQEKQNLDYVTTKLNESFTDRAKRIPTVPKHVEYSMIQPLISDLSNLPMGINTVTAQYEYYDFEQKITLMSASKADAIRKFIKTFVKTLSACKNNKIIVLSAIENINISESDSIKYYNSNFKKILPVLNKNILKMNKDKSDSKYIVIVLGYSKLNNHMKKMKESDKGITVDDLVLNSDNDNFKFVIFDDYNKFSNIMNGKLSDVVDNQNGVWLGTEYDEQECFEAERNYSEVSVSNDSLVVIKDSVASFVKYPIVK